jgi:hypothetical protein
MSLASILTAAGLTLPLMMTGVYWLLRSFIQHRLTAAIEEQKAGFAKALETHKSALAKDLEEKKASLQAELARDKAGVEGEVRRAVELELGQQAAERQYVSEARRRLYLAIGPLRFQLLLACRDCAGRIVAHGTRESYALDMNGYYGQSTLYRLLRPLAIAELIERQIADSDFSVDKGAIDCLRFKKTLIRILSGDEIICDHPNANWNDQIEHVYADAAVEGACGLICEDTNAPRVMRFAEFRDLVGQEGMARFAPFPSVLQDLARSKRPILWVRLVAYANACSHYVAHAGPALDFEQQVVPVAELITAGQDSFIEQNKAKFVQAIEANALMRL